LDKDENQLFILKFIAMKKLTFLLAFMIPIFLSAQTYIFPGPVSGTWDLDGSPYLVNGSIYVDKTSSLDIEAGVTVIIAGWYEFAIYGELNAIGAENNKILFTTNHPTVVWQGIRFIQPHVNSVLAHCIIEKGEAPLGGALYFFRTYDQEILVQNTLIRNNKAVYGGGVYCTESNPIFENCEITENVAQVGGGLYLAGQSDIILRSSIITRNKADNGGGLRIMRSAPQLISNSINMNIANLSGGALSIEESDHYIMRKNEIANNAAATGGAIHLLNSNGSYCNNTLTFNDAHEKGGAMYFDGDSDPEIMNSILYFNDAYVADGGVSVNLASKESDPDFMYCDIEGGLIGFKGSGAGLNYTGKYEGCLTADPLFKDAVNGDFSVTWDNYPHVDETKSPCIDAGCPNSIGDPDCTCCDMGAFFFFQLLEVPEALPPAAMQELAFLATWTEAYGALGYYLDVAIDPDFAHYLIKKKDVGNSQVCVVQVPTMRTYYYRLRAYNSTLLSDYSNTAVVLMVSVEEQDEHNISIYSANQEVCIRIEDQLKTSGELKVYSLSGQLITEQRVNSGLNRISIDGPDQIVIIKMLLDGKAYQEKLMLR
jgi:hypothetical protein